MNLIHTFEGGCVSPNDNVNDTPPCNYPGASYTCHASPTSTYPVNCNAALINAENYMDYSGATGCYKMFTQGQVTRMYAALLHPARQTLWQTSNLDTTGLNQLCLTTGFGNYSLSDDFNFYPNPSNDNINILVNSNILNSNYFIYDQLEREILSGKLISENTNVNIGELTKGIYFLKIGGEDKIRSVKKLIRN